MVCCCPSEGTFVAWVPRDELPIAPVIDLEVRREVDSKNRVDDVLGDLVQNLADVAPCNKGHLIGECLAEGEGRLEFSFRVGSGLDDLEAADFGRSCDSSLDRREVLDPKILKFIDLEVAINNRGPHYVKGLVFVLVRQGVEHPKRMVWRPLTVLVGLNSQDMLASVPGEFEQRRRPAKARPMTGLVAPPKVPLLLEDGECHPGLGRKVMPIVGTDRKLPCHVIKGGVEIVEDVAYQRRPSSRWIEGDPLDPPDGFFCLRIEAADKFVRCRFSEPLDRYVQHFHVAYRPL